MKNRFLKTFIFSILLITTLFLGMASAWEIPGGWDNFNRALRVIPDGTSTAPAWAFKSEPTLGFYRSGSGVISLVGGNLNLGANELLLDSLKLNDSDDSHYLEILTNSNLTGNRILTITPGDAARTITLSGNPTLSDWFDQGVKTTGTPTFNSLILSANWYQAAGTYHNFGATLGATGYGIYDNAGTLQFKNSGGAWADLVSAVSAGGWQDDGGIVRLITGADNVGMGGATAGGTNLAGGLVWNNGTAPTTYPANASQFWMADEGSRGGYSHPHFANEAGQNGAIAFQSPLVNLLSNSGFRVWSNGTLENVGSDLAVNGGFDSDTTSWTAINATIASIVGGQSGNALEVTRIGDTYQGARQTAAPSIVVGKIYKLTGYVKSGSSGNEAYRIKDDSGSTAFPQIDGTSTGSWVQFSRTFEATTTTCPIYIYKIGATAGTMLFDSITLYEVTPGCVAADTLAADGHSKTSTLDAHEYWNAGSANTYGYGKYLLKLTKGADTAEYYNFNKLGIDYRDVQGKKVTFATYVYSVTATDNIKLSIHDGVSEIAVSSAFIGADAITWVEVTGTVAANATAITARVLADGDTSDVAYVSPPMLVKGPSIGAGNYAPSPNETIYTEKVIALTDYTATTSAADATINLEAQSSGFIPKGVKAVLVKAYGKDSAAGDGVGFDVQSASGVEDGLSIDTQVNNVRVQGVGWIKADANGDIYFDHRGSGASALTVDLKVIGVQP